MGIINEKNKLEYQILMFIVIGGLATIIDFIIYNYLLAFISINFSKLISMLVSSLFSYFMNKIFTFNKGKNYNSKYLIKFYIIFLLNLLTNIFVNYYAYKWTSIKNISFYFSHTFWNDSKFYRTEIFMFLNKLLFS